MRIRFLGTCAGTEPMPGRKHVSFTVEQGGAVYWFDAGEGCSYTAHLAGVDLLSVRAIFISHTHMDHVGGLANLLWTMRKLQGLARDKPHNLTGKTIRLFIPGLKVWRGIRQVLSGTEDGFKIDFRIRARACQDGLLYEDPHCRVIALHNHHLAEPADGRTWLSYSFRIEAGGKAVVYSGDVSGIGDIDPLVDDCDLLLMETGHHHVEDVCRELADGGKTFGRLAFIHHGRDILRDPVGEAEKARRILGDRVIVADDGMTLEL